MTDRAPLAAPTRVLHAVLAATLDRGALTWLDEGIAALASAEGRPPVPADPAFFVLTQRYAAAARRLGLAPVGAGAADLPTPCGPLDAAGWHLADAGRACLLAAALGAGEGLDETRALGLVRSLFREAEEGERVSLVRGLCLIPAPGALLPVAREATRINSLRLFGALALDNPYPAAWYQDRDFNALVLKCLFNGLPIVRVQGLSRRANPALSRLAEDYREERLLAGRTVPPDIWLALAPHATGPGLDLALEALACDDPGHRYWAARALAARADEPALRDALGRRLPREGDPRVAEILDRALRPGPSR